MAENRFSAVGEQAAALFKCGWNCAEAVCIAVGEATGRPVPVELATSFGAGIGKSGGTCGALTGAILSLGPFLGRTAPGRRAWTRAAGAGRRVSSAFREEFGFTECFVFSPQEKTPRQPRARCPDCVRRAAELAMEVLDDLPA